MDCFDLSVNLVFGLLIYNKLTLSLHLFIVKIFLNIALTAGILLLCSN